jgi:hypothetical protein
MKIISLSGKAHHVWIQWDFILHEYGNLTLGELSVKVK